MANGNDSPLKKTWIRLKKNKPAIASLTVICIAIILAIIGPSIAPDKTPDADDQILELANMNPGFSTKVLLLQKNREEKSPSVISRIFLGTENQNEMIPINSYAFDDSANIVLQTYEGEGRTSLVKTFPIVDVCEALSNTKPEIQLNGDKATFTDFSEKQKTVSLAELKKEIEEQRVVTKTYHLGTDGYGRDILSRLLFGVRVSLSVGLVAVLISLTIGIFMGSVAGFYRDDTLQTTMPSIIAFFLSIGISYFILYNFFDLFKFYYIKSQDTFSNSIVLSILSVIFFYLINFVLFLFFIFKLLLLPIIVFLGLRKLLKKVLSFFEKKYSVPVDSVVMWFINVIWAIPTILLAMAIRFAIGDKIPSFLAIFIAVGLSMWVEVARIVRGQVLGVREMEYVQAARGLGFNNARIIIKHILPNIIGPIMVIAASDFASAILIEAGLSFVGIGVKPPTPSWGTMLNDHRAYLLTPGKAFLALAPGMCIMIMVLAFNLLGNGLRDAFDVKGKTV